MATYYVSHPYAASYKCITTDKRQKPSYGAESDKQPGRTDGLGGTDGISMGSG